MDSTACDRIRKKKFPYKWARMEKGLLPLYGAVEADPLICIQRIAVLTGTPSSHIFSIETCSMDICTEYASSLRPHRCSEFDWRPDILHLWGLPPTTLEGVWMDCSAVASGHVLSSYIEHWKWSHRVLAKRLKPSCSNEMASRSQTCCWFWKTIPPQTCQWFWGPSN